MISPVAISRCKKVMWVTSTGAEFRAFIVCDARQMAIYIKPQKICRFAQGKKSAVAFTRRKSTPLVRTITSNRIPLHAIG